MSRNRVLLALAMAMSTVILVAAVGGQPNATDAASPAHSIVGSWVFVPAGIPGRPQGTPSLFTFTSDGTVLHTSSTPGVKGGQGVWVSTGSHTATVTWVQVYRNANDEFIGTGKARVKVTLNETFDALTTVAKLDRFDAQGNLVNSFDVTARGTRIKVESP